MDQIRRKVDNGQLLNFDACFGDPQVWAIAAAQKQPGDDAGMTKTRTALCTNFFKNGYWRGGINAAIDDRKSVDANEWTPEKRKQYVQIRDDIKANFTNNINVIKSQSAPAALEYPGAVQQVEAAHGMVDSLSGRLAAETDRLNAYLSVLQSKNGPELLSEVAETEFKLRNLEKENREYEKTAELRSEQAGGLYNQYEGNYHSSSFGYMPIHPASRSALLTVAVFFGFIALILIGIKLAVLIMGAINTPGTVRLPTQNSFTKMTRPARPANNSLY